MIKHTIYQVVISQKGISVKTETSTMLSASRFSEAEYCLVKALIENGIRDNQGLQSDK